LDQVVSEVKTKAQFMYCHLRIHNTIVLDNTNTQKSQVSPTKDLQATKLNEAAPLETREEQKLNNDISYIHISDLDNPANGKVQIRGPFTTLRELRKQTKLRAEFQFCQEDKVPLSEDLLVAEALYSGRNLSICRLTTGSSSSHGEEQNRCQLQIVCKDCHERWNMQIEGIDPTTTLADIRRFLTAQEEGHFALGYFGFYFNRNSAIDKRVESKIYLDKIIQQKGHQKVIMITHT